MDGTKEKSDKKIIVGATLSEDPIPKKRMSPEEYEAFFIWLTEVKGLSELTAQLYAGHVSRGNDTVGYSHNAARKHYAEYQGTAIESNNEYAVNGDTCQLRIKKRNHEIVQLDVRIQDLDAMKKTKWFISTNSRGYITVYTRIKGKRVTLNQYLKNST